MGDMGKLPLLGLEEILVKKKDDVLCTGAEGMYYSPLLIV